jgi:hypothetical protein
LNYVYLVEVIGERKMKNNTRVLAPTVAGGQLHFATRYFCMHGEIVIFACMEKIVLPIW